MTVHAEQHGVNGAPAGDYASRAQGAGESTQFQAQPETPQFGIERRIWCI
ncbi:MAG: hypothetical protein M3Y72_05125 [Acidobacteriota bacterium]|nr:hypothetical protein [Acidobacteriota bacterium]